MNQIISPIRWTIHDLDALPENEGIRREIIDGELFVTRAPHWQHQNIITNISAALHNWSKTYSGFVIPSPGIIPSKEDSVIPDLVWVSNERLVAIEVRPKRDCIAHWKANLDEAGHFTGFPELVVEVLSAGERNIYRDKQAKLKLYSQGEVQEYWIVDRFRQELEIYRLEKRQLVLVETLTESDTLTSSLFPNFSLLVCQIFA